MKTKTSVRTLLAVVAWCVGAGVAALTPAWAQEAKPRMETAELAVLKTFSVQDGPYRQRSYLIEWKGTQVIAEDGIRRGEYRAEQKAPVFVYKGPYPHGEKPHGLMRFRVGSSRDTVQAQPEPALAEKAMGEHPTRERLKVIRAIALEEEGHVHRGYLVDWKGREAYVSDILSGTDYKVGDVIPVLIMRQAHPRPEVKEGILRMTTTEALAVMERRSSI